MTDSEERCKTMVPDGGRSVRFHRCTRRAKKDGYCTQHHPASVEARRKESEHRFQRQLENSPLRRYAKRVKKLEAALRNMRCSDPACGMINSTPCHNCKIKAEALTQS